MTGMGRGCRLVWMIGRMGGGCEIGFRVVLFELVEFSAVVVWLFGYHVCLHVVAPMLLFDSAAA